MYLNVPARWVAEAVRQRRVRCTRIGKHVRFKIEHLEELVAAGEQPVTGPRVRLRAVPTETVDAHASDAASRVGIPAPPSMSRITGAGWIRPPRNAVSTTLEISSSPTGNKWPYVSMVVVMDS